MPNGKIIPYQPNEYPELDNLKEGAMVDFQGTAKIVKTGGTEEGGEGEGSMGLEIMGIDLTPSDNEATTELNRMTGKNMKPAPAMGKSAGGF